MREGGVYQHEAKKVQKLFEDKLSNSILPALSYQQTSDPRAKRIIRDFHIIAVLNCMLSIDTHLLSD